LQLLYLFWCVIPFVTHVCVLLYIGGADRGRTCDLLDANQTLSQLSYGPKLYIYL
jgi:hypothetical protein